VNPLVDKHRKDLTRICREFRVRTLEIFGSAAGEQYDETASDLDFLVDFMPWETTNAADRYFGLRSALADLFERHVDLVMVKALKNPFFIESVNATRVVLYAA
jgi:predicted nucleotidyltransferase